MVDDDDDDDDDDVTHNFVTHSSFTESVFHHLLYLLFNLLSIAISLAGTAYTDCL